MEENPAVDSGGGASGLSTGAPAIARPMPPTRSYVTMIDIRCPGPRPLRLVEWKVTPGTAVRMGSVLALCVPVAERGAGQNHRSQRPVERKVKSDRVGVVQELCGQPGQVFPPGPQSKNGRQQAQRSTASVAMVHSVPELMVSSEQAEQLGREDQQRLHRNQKLVLMVDLDQTLIHTTEQHYQQISNKGIFHFQLGRGEPMLHTRLRPHCKEFLEKIAKLYELHVFTFGSRLYAHTIAGFLDPEKKLFSHRILSRDECIDPFSKTGNLRNLFPCGDAMVCIIDDREDVWKFAPNLVTVKKYVYFQGTGDINAPPGSKEAQMRKKVNHSSKSSELPDPAVAASRVSEESKRIPVEEQSNGIETPTEEQNGTTADDVESKSDIKLSDNADKILTVNETSSLSTDTVKIQNPVNVRVTSPSVDQDSRTLQSKTVEPAKDKSSKTDMDFDLSSDSDNESVGGKATLPSSDSDSENGEKRSWKRSTNPTNDGAVQEVSSTEIQEEKEDRINHSGDHGPETDSEDKPNRAQSVNEQDGLHDLGNGCSDKKEAETESQNSEQSGVTMGESLDQSVEEEEAEDDADEDDHLIYLEEILVRIHGEYYTQYEKYISKEIYEVPDLRRIVPELKSKVLEGLTLVFSGLYPTNYPIERTREYYHATTLGAKVNRNLILKPDDPNRTSHLIAARPGTEKVRQAQGCKHLCVVNPDWLWSCLERWEKTEELLFPLKEDYIKTQRCNSPATFPDIQSAFQTALFHPTPIHPKVQPGPEVRIYDPSTGKLIRKGSQSSTQSPFIQAPAPPVTLPVHGEHSSFRVVQPHQQQMLDDEELSDTQEDDQPGPSRRKRQPSMSETMPLYTLCKEDLESMDREVDDILGEESEDSGSERDKAEEKEEASEHLHSKATEELGTEIEHSRESSSSEGSLTASVPRGHKRKLEEVDAASQSSKGSSNDDDEGSSSEADEMAAALEAELNDFM
ncbi:RNA polymerase II subunit A C-terminal domain phosphatase isoform X2 [Protopterus annectens]|uniref:RNA polymerase II subunit A C-terminal domain phosphatase isoform X2 n=1 Tax=Protopterus annectens TaxID=7888 RepID=UPI001CFA2A3F|nr:RNA polymerase II subunit A C-terminal domain phosphatase isoform X2 [Protopterus annectens]